VQPPRPQVSRPPPQPDFSQKSLLMAGERKGEYLFNGYTGKVSNPMRLNARELGSG